MPNNIMYINGIVGFDPETRYVGNGTALTRFSIATQRQKRPNSDDKPPTDWISCQSWGKLAEKIAQEVKKGDRLMVAGRGQINVVKGEGETKTYFNLNVTEVARMILPDRDSESTESKTSSNKEEPPPADDDDDLPF